MRFFPYERLTLRTDSPADVVKARLEELIATRWFSLTAPPEPFRGSIEGRHFKVVRVLGMFLGLRTYNSFQPVIVGDVVPVSGGTEVRVRMRLSTFVGVFTAFWFGGLLWGFGMLLLGGVRDGFGPSTVCDGQTAAGTGVELLLVSVMMLAGFALVSVAFWSEVKKARRALAEGLGCREIAAENRLIRR